MTDTNAFTVSGRLGRTKTSGRATFLTVENERQDNGVRRSFIECTCFEASLVANWQQGDPVEVSGHIAFRKDEATNRWHPQLVVTAGRKLGGGRPPQQSRHSGAGWMGDDSGASDFDEPDGKDNIPF